MTLTLAGARLVDALQDIDNSRITIDGASIRAVGDALRSEGEIVDASGLIVTPGFVDVHTHGGGMFNLHTTDPDEIRAYARWAPSTGTTAFLIGTVGVPDGLPEAQIRAAVAAIRANDGGSEPVGIHMEGPYINARRRGAHDPQWLRLPDEAETERILELTEGYLALITLAPELPGSTQLIRRLAAAGVTISMGHTDASYEDARDAIPLGITHATHCFNAMRPLNHRKPGPIGAIVEADQISGEIIADGVHVHPAAMRLLIRALGPARTIVVTDALACAGVPDASFTFAGQPARVVDGAARLADGTLTGSALTMDQALRNLVQMLGLPLSEAVGMLTSNPARSARVAGRKGRLLPGYEADLLVFDDHLRLQATFCRGQLAFATEMWLERHGIAAGQQ